jgi:hypothetical protein
MALVVTMKKMLKASNIKINTIDVAFDNSYPTGGETLTPQQMGLSNVEAVIPLNTKGYMMEYDAANKKLMAYYGDNNNANDGPMVEVADTTDLSAITAAKLICIGY